MPVASSNVLSGSLINRNMSEEDAITYEEILEMLMESQFWPPDVMRDFQHTQLEQLLRHARANVPFYEKRLDCMFRKDDSIDWERWDEIPIVTRENLRDHGGAMKARVLPPGHGKVYSASSSGSTGVPITVSFPKIAISAGEAAWQRMMLAHGFDAFKCVADFKLKSPNGELPGPAPFEKPASTGGRRYFHIDRRAATEEKIAQLKACQVNLVIDAPISLEIMARVNLMQNVPLKFEGALGTGMGFTEIQRKLIFESFGARCLSPYSSKEGSLIAAECPDSRWFHVSAEILHLEVLDEQGKHVPIGEKGRSIITPFYYTAQPLIRYDQGDIVVPGTPCTCGCTLPTIKSIEGRSDPIFSFPDREAPLTGLDYEALRQNLDAIALQIAQVGPIDLEIRYVAAVSASQKGMSKFMHHLKEVIGLDIAVSFKRVDSIPFNAGGKQQRRVREFQPVS
jgi:phenylacetate-CoA ligase